MNPGEGGCTRSADRGSASLSIVPQADQWQLCRMEGGVGPLRFARCDGLVTQCLFIGCPDLAGAISFGDYPEEFRGEESAGHPVPQMKYHQMWLSHSAKTLYWS